MNKPRVARQGKVVVEQHDGDFYLMFPDGCVEILGSREAAERAAKAWFKKHASDDAINVGEIEWR